MKSIVKKEGGKALFKGVSARMLFFVPSSATTMALFEFFKGKLQGKGKERGKNKQYN